MSRSGSRVPYGMLAFLCAAAAMFVIGYSVSEENTPKAAVGAGLAAVGLLLALRSRR